MKISEVLIKMRGFCEIWIVLGDEELIPCDELIYHDLVNWDFNVSSRMKDFFYWLFLKDLIIFKKVWDLNVFPICEFDIKQVGLFTNFNEVGWILKFEDVRSLTSLIIRWICILINNSSIEKFGGLKVINEYVGVCSALTRIQLIFPQLELKVNIRADVKFILISQI